jgi:hypothetical protein
MAWGDRNRESASIRWLYDVGTSRGLAGLVNLRHLLFDFSNVHLFDNEAVGASHRQRHKVIKITRRGINLIRFKPLLAVSKGFFSCGK